MFSSFLLPLLFVWCGLIAWSDWSQRRIPNALIAAGFAFALLGLAFLGQTPFGATPLHSMLGAFAGLLSFIPLYIAKIMGAGDVKLFAAIGAMLGVWALFPVWLIASLLAGLHALIWASSVRLMPRLAAAPGAGVFGRLPYGAHLAMAVICVVLKPTLVGELSFGLLP